MRYWHNFSCHTYRYGCHIYKCTTSTTVQMWYTSRDEINVTTRIIFHTSLHNYSTLLWIWLLDYWRDLFQGQIRPRLLSPTFLIWWIHDLMALKHRLSQGSPYMSLERSELCPLLWISEIFFQRVISWTVFNCYFSSIDVVLNVEV